MSDTFKYHKPGLSSPASGAFEITPDDNTPLSHVTRAIYVGGDGDLTITVANGQTVTLTSVQSGAIYPIRCSGVLRTGTTATGIVGLF